MRVRAFIISYSVKSRKFDSNYERNKFYRGLFGFKQTVRKNNKTYNYRKEGLFDKIPNVKVDESVFIVPRNEFEELEEYFEHWKNKVLFKTMKIMIDDKVWG